MRYVIEPTNFYQKEIANRQTTANQLIEDLDPIYDELDRRILFETTKRRVEADDFHEDTSFEDCDQDDSEENQSKDQFINSLTGIFEKKQTLIGDYDLDVELHGDGRKSNMSVPKKKNDDKGGQLTPPMEEDLFDPQSIQ